MYKMPELNIPLNDDEDFTIPDDIEFKAPSTIMSWRDVPINSYAIKSRKTIDTSIGTALVLTIINKNKESFEAFAPHYLSQCLTLKHKYIKVEGKKEKPFNR